VGAHTSYAVVSAALFVIGLGLGATIMPLFAAAYQGFTGDDGNTTDALRPNFTHQSLIPDLAQPPRSPRSFIRWRSQQPSPIAITVMSGNLQDIRSGCCAWRLPPDETIAGVARSLVKQTLQPLRLPVEMIEDSVTMVSELTTNVVWHTLRGQPAAPVAGLPELWMYRRTHPYDIMIKIFDASPWRSSADLVPLLPEPDAEHGRGLQIVDTLSRARGAEWGRHRSRSRLGVAPVPGKAVYFTLPLPSNLLPPLPTPGTVGQAADELQELLAARGFDRLHRSDGWQISVLSVSTGITVWIRNGAFSLTTFGEGGTRFALADLQETAEQIVRYREDLRAAALSAAAR
jgi:hypothetical protein